MSDEDLNYRIVSTAGQFSTKPRLRRELAVFEDWELPDSDEGDCPAVWAYELLGEDYCAWQASGWSVQNGARVFDMKYDELRYLAHGLRNNDGQRLWPSWEDGVRELKTWPRTALVIALRALNKANEPRVRATASAEGKEADAS